MARPSQLEAGDAAEPLPVPRPAVGRRPNHASRPHPSPRATALRVTVLTAHEGLDPLHPSPKTQAVGPRATWTAWARWRQHVQHVALASHMHPPNPPPPVPPRSRRVRVNACSQRPHRLRTGWRVKSVRGPGQGDSASTGCVVNLSDSHRSAALFPYCVRAARSSQAAAHHRDTENAPRQTWTMEKQRLIPGPRLKGPLG
jgi:hypothetical protein